MKSFELLPILWFIVHVELINKQVFEWFMKYIGTILKLDMCELIATFARYIKLLAPVIHHYIILHLMVYFKIMFIMLDDL